MEDFISKVRNAKDLGPVPWWHPTEKTPVIAGELVEYRGPIDTSFGPLRGAVLRIEAPAPAKESKGSKPYLAQEGDYVAVWLKETVLTREWANPAPGGPEPMIGERVGVKLTGKRQGDLGEYRTFKVFVDRQTPAVVEHSGRDEGPPEREPMDQGTALSGAADLDDDLPF